MVVGTTRTFRSASRRPREISRIGVFYDTVEETLARNGSNVTKSAEETGMQRSNFQALMKKYGIRVRDTEPGEDAE